MDIVIIDGPQGCGKTTHADELRQHFYCEEVVGDHAFRLLLQGMQVSGLNLLSQTSTRLLVLTNDRASLVRFLEDSITNHGFPRERIIFCDFEEAIRAINEGTWPLLEEWPGEEQPMGHDMTGAFMALRRIQTALDHHNAWQGDFELVERMLEAAESRKAEIPVRHEEVPVLHELEAARSKFPTWPNDPLHALGVLQEEVGELSKAVLQEVYEPEKNPKGSVRKEAIQAAAVALRFVASLSRYQYRACTQHDQAGH